MYANYGAYSDDQRMAAQERIDRLKRQQAEERTAASATGERIRKETADIDKLYEAYKKKDSQKTDPEKSYYQSTSETIARQIEQLKLEAQQEGALTNAQKLRIQIENQAADSKKKLTAAHKEYLNKQLDELEALEKAASDRKFIKDYEKQYRDELDKTVKSYEDQIAVVGPAQPVIAQERVVPRLFYGLHHALRLADGHCPVGRAVHYPQRYAAESAEILERAASA